MIWCWYLSDIGFLVWCFYCLTVLCLAVCQRVCTAQLPTIQISVVVRNYRHNHPRLPCFSVPLPTVFAVFAACVLVSHPQVLDQRDRRRKLQRLSCPVVHWLWLEMSPKLDKSPCCRPLVSALSAALFSSMISRAYLFFSSISLPNPSLANAGIVAGCSSGSQFYYKPAYSLGLGGSWPECSTILAMAYWPRACDGKARIIEDWLCDWLPNSHLPTTGCFKAELGPVWQSGILCEINAISQQISKLWIVEKLYGFKDL